jgi:hypothetical protein
MEIGIDAAVGSTPTKSIFITLRNYGIQLSLFLSSCQTKPPVSKNIVLLEIGTFSWLRFWFWLGVGTATSSVSIENRKDI